MTEKRKFRIVKPLVRLEKYPVIHTWDTEAYRYETPTGERQEFATGWIANSEKSFRFSSINEFVDYAFSLKGKNMILAHNAMYDLQLTGLKYWLLTHDEYNGMKRVRDMILDDKVWVKYVRKGKNCAEVIFADSYQFLPASLADLSKKYLKAKKFAVKTDYEMPCAEWNEYIRANGDDLCRTDAEQLYQIFMKFLDFLKSNNYPLGLSIASTAFKTFRLCFMGNAELFYPNDEDYDNDIIEAYRGGYTNVIRTGEYENVTVYDVNSLYPASMLNKMPVRYRSKIRIQDYDHYQRMKRKYYIIAKCDFVCGEDISFITKRIDAKLYPLKSGSGVLHEPEIDYIIATGGIVRFEYAYVYDFVTDLFTQYVDAFYSMKCTAPDDVSRELAKLFLNSLYGKFGQHGRYARIITGQPEDELDKPLRYDDGEGHVIADYGYFKIIREGGYPKYSPEIAGAVTAYARIALWKYVRMIGTENWLYSDTDSIHTQTRILNVCVSDKLGDLKIEKQGTAIYVAPKVYYFNGLLKHKGLNGRDKRIEQNTYIHKQFSKLRTLDKSGVTVTDVRKRYEYINDKLCFDGDTAVRAYTEEEILRPKLLALKTKERRLADKFEISRRREAEANIDGFTELLDGSLSKAEGRDAFWRNLKFENQGD